MKLFTLYIIVLLLSIVVSIGSGSYGIYYKTSGTATEYKEQAYHGPQSILLWVNKDRSYSKIRTYLDDSITLEELDEFTAQVRLMGGNDGRIKIDLYLDGDGDGEWKSTSKSDAKLYANVYPWTEDKWTLDQWTELNALDLSYKKSGESNLGEKKIGEWKESLGSAGIVKIYITLYERSDESGSCLIDYLRIVDNVLSFEPFEYSKMKWAKPYRVSPGGKITYTITYGNDLMEPITNLKVVEHYDPRTNFLSATPPPDSGTNNVWTIGTVPPGHYGQIVIVVRASNQKCEADINGRVSGEGYVSVSRRFSTERSAHIITNSATISCDQFSQNATVRTAVKPVDENSITFVERGSGEYKSSDDLTYRSYKMVMEREFEGNQYPTVVNLSTRSSLVYNTCWYANQVCENQKRISLLSEWFRGDRMKLDSFAEARSTRAVMGSDANFSGLAVYEVGSETKERRALLMSILEGNFSVKTSSDVYK